MLQCYYDDIGVKMTKTMSIRELTRNGNMFNKYDYIDIEDKKSKNYKGVFVSAKYADMVKKFLEEQILKEKQDKLNKLMKFAGTIEVDADFKTKDAKEIRKIIAEGKYSE